MQRTTLALAVLAAVALCSVGLAIVAGATGGAGTQAGTVAITPNESVTLAPGEGPNGAYASLDDGELRLDLEDLNRHGRTTAHRVFTIESDADRPLSVAVESDTDVDFYWGASPGRSASRGRELAPGETVAVGVAAHAAEEATGGNFSVVVDRHVELGDEDEDDEREDVEIGVVDGDLRVPNAGQSTDVAVPVHNTRGYAITRTFELSVDGVVVDSKTVRLEPGATTTITFERSFQRAGTYELAVNGVRVGTVTVEGDAFSVDGASLSPPVVERGESVTVAADVTNHADEAGTFVAELEVGGAVVDRRAVHVAAGETESVTFERTFDRRGGYDVAVSGADAGTVQVESAYGASVRRYGAAYGPLLGALSVPTLGGALVLARGRDGVLVARPAK